MNKPEPYDGFKNDEKRRQALATRERWRAVTVVSLAIAVNASGVTRPVSELLARLLHHIG